VERQTHSSPREEVCRSGAVTGRHGLDRYQRTMLFPASKHRRWRRPRGSSSSSYVILTQQHALRIARERVRFFASQQPSTRAAESMAPPSAGRSVAVRAASLFPFSSAFLHAVTEAGAGAEGGLCMLQSLFLYPSTSRCARRREPLTLTQPTCSASSVAAGGLRFERGRAPSSGT